MHYFKFLRQGHTFRKRFRWPGTRPSRRQAVSWNPSVRNRPLQLFQQCKRFLRGSLFCSLWFPMEDAKMARHVAGDRAAKLECQQPRQSTARNINHIFLYFASENPFRRKGCVAHLFSNPYRNKNTMHGAHDLLHSVFLSYLGWCSMIRFYDSRAGQRVHAA